MLSLKKLKITCLSVLVAVALSSCGGTGSNGNPIISGVLGPNVSFVNGLIILSMTFQNINLAGGATLPIPGYPNSSVQVGPDFQSAGTLLVLTVSAKDVIGNAGVLLPSQTLPGGRPLPSVAAGVMPALAIQIPALFNTVLYIGPSILGFFVPVGGLNLAGSIVSFRFNDVNGNPAGILSIVGTDSAGANSGILAMMDLNLLGVLNSTPTPTPTATPAP